MEITRASSTNKFLAPEIGAFSRSQLQDANGDCFQTEKLRGAFPALALKSTKSDLWAPSPVG